MLTPVVVPWIQCTVGLARGVRWIGALGFVLLAFWALIYRKPEEHPRVSKAEFAYIRSDPQVLAGKIRWLPCFPLRQTWAFVIGKFSHRSDLVVLISSGFRVSCRASTVWR